MTRASSLGSLKRWKSFQRPHFRQSAAVLTLSQATLILLTVLVDAAQHADVYTSRVSNFLTTTPHFYFRSPAQSLAHDRAWSADHAARMASESDGKIFVLA